MMKYNDEYHDSDEFDNEEFEKEIVYRGCGDKYLISPDNPKRVKFSRFVALIGVIDIVISIYE